MLQNPDRKSTESGIEYSDSETPLEFLVGEWQSSKHEPVIRALAVERVRSSTVNKTRHHSNDMLSSIV